MFIKLLRLRPFLIPATIVTFLLFHASASSEDKAPVLFEQCSACHGAKGEGNKDLKSPAIAGQFSWYLTRQLSNYAKGLRGAHKDDINGKLMIAQVALLDFENDVPALSTYIESLPVTSQNDQTDALDKHRLMNGSRYYQGKCGACHGGVGQGNPSFNAPKLNNLSEDYLMRQMSHFTVGIRGTEKDDKFGRQMAMMAKTTSGKELKDIIYYINSNNPAVSE